MSLTFTIVNDFDKLVGDINQARGIMKVGGLRRPGTHRRFQKVIRDEIQGFAKDAFRTEGSSTPRKWKKLAKSTLKHKKGRRILRETGKLFRAHTRRRKWITLKQTIRGFIITMETPDDPDYAIFHHKGTSKMRARKILSYTRSQRNKLEIVSRAFILREWLRIPGFLK